MTMTTMRTWPIPGHPGYEITEDARALGPRRELKQFYPGGHAAVSSRNGTIYLRPIAGLIWYGTPDVEPLDGDLANWRRDNLAPKPISKKWWWSRAPTGLEIEYARLRGEAEGFEDLLRVPYWYVKRIRDIGSGPDQ